MPRGDGTGPAGMGPMTGRAAGYCAGYEVPGNMNPVPGRGLGFGKGRGLGRGLGLGFRGGRRRGDPYGAPHAPPAAFSAYGAAPAPEQEVEMLKGQAESLEESLEAIRKRISELGADKRG